MKIVRETLYRDFRYTGFGLHVPSLDPQLSVHMKAQKENQQVILHISVRISGEHHTGLFVSETEDRLAASFEPDETIDYSVLAGEAESSVQRCIAHGRNTCISRAYYYPLIDCYPALDLEQAATHIADDIHGGVITASNPLAFTDLKYYVLPSPLPGSKLVRFIRL